MTKQETLYERVGGYDAIYAFTEDVIARLMDNEETGVIWNHMSEERVFKEHLNGVDFFCKHWGGPQTYSGRDLITVHKGMGITERHWTIFIEIVEQAFDKFGVPQDLRTEITAFFEAHKPHVVGSPSFREVVRGPDGQKFTGGMEAFGVKWP
jgi:hemoglobin